MSLPTRKIGDTQVTAIGYGAMGIAAFYGAAESDEQRLKVLDELYASGCTNWDTADIYGDSEELIGKWFKRTGNRDKIFLATKFGFAHGQNERVICGEPQYIAKAIDKSLARLGVDQVDLYYLHRADSATPIEETVGAMAELVKAGKVKYLGLSECSANNIRRAHAVHPIAAIQVEYSPFTLDIEDEKIAVLKTARELGIAVIAYSPLGRGLLTGKYKGPEDFEENDFRRMVPRFAKENFPRILKVTETLGEIGKKYNATAGQVALAWILAQGEDFIPIPGSAKVANIRENLAALKLQLSAEDLKAVRELAEEADKAVPGSRYPEAMMQTLFVDTPPLQK